MVTRFQLALLRIVACSVAIVFASDWLLSKPRLRMESSTQSTGVANRTNFKGQAMVELSQTAVGPLRIACSDAEALCSLRRDAQVTLWLQRPGLLQGYWVVAADYRGKRIVAAERQQELYRTSRWIWGFAALVTILVAVALVKFPPDVENPDE